MQTNITAARAREIITELLEEDGIESTADSVYDMAATLRAGWHAATPSDARTAAIKAYSDIMVEVRS